jgi:hypothetical protein
MLGDINMKYKFKKNDTVYMIFIGWLLKGTIEKRYKDEDGENCYFVNFSSSNSGLSYVCDVMQIQENVLHYNRDSLFISLHRDLKNRLEYKGLKL